MEEAFPYVQLYPPTVALLLRSRFQTVNNDSTMPALDVDAILFDLDGTLIDERESYREAIRLTAQLLLAAPVERAEVEEIKRVPGFNNDWDATWGLIGRRLHGSILRVGDADRGSYAYRRMVNVFQTYYLGDDRWSELSGAEPPFPWKEPFILRERMLVRPATLERLARFQLGIATSRPRAEALLALRQHDLDRFFPPETVVAREDAAREKPHPAPLRELVRRLGCRRPVYVGDTVNDALAAAGAGMPYIHIAPDGPALPAHVTHCIDDVNAVVHLCLDE